MTHSLTEAKARAVDAAFEKTMGTLGMPDANDASYDEWFRDTFAANLFASLRESGVVLVEMEPLVETLGKALASQGHSVGPESLITFEDDDGHEYSAPYWLFHEYDQEAKRIIEKLAASSPTQEG